MPVAEFARGIAQLGFALIVLSVGVGTVYHTFVAIRRSTTNADATPRMPRRATEARRPVCGIIDGGSQCPCVLERDHRDHEHATCWFDAGDSRKQTRHRWDANDVLGRDELRWKPEYLPRFTPDGERA